MEDPFVGEIEGYANVIANYEQTFAENDIAVTTLLELNAGSCTAMELSLVITGKDGKAVRIDGVDLVEVEGGKITSLRAYLDTSRAPGSP